MPIKSWAMWGSSQVLTVNSGAGPGNPITTQQAQLARINHHRPEAWGFQFGGRILGGRQQGGAAGAIWVYAFFDLQIGLGRTVWDTTTPNLTKREAFCTFKWVVSNIQNPGEQANNHKFVTSVFSAPLIDDEGPPPRYAETDHIVGQDIQCAVRVHQVAGDPGTQAIVEVGAFFAPLGSWEPEAFK